VVGSLDKSVDEHWGCEVVELGGGEWDGDFFSSDMVQHS